MNVFGCVVERSESMEEVAVWFVFLPRIDSRKAKIWSTRMEYSVRVQRDGSQNLRATTGDVPEPIRR